MKTVLTLLIMGTLATASMAQEKKSFKEIKLALTGEIINVSADNLWEIIGPGFNNVSQWATTVDHAVTSGTPQHEGATCNERSCDLNAKGFSKIKEVITIYDKEKQTLAFDITEGLPGFVQVSNSHWQVIDLGNDQSKIEITISIKADKFMGTLMGGMFKSNIKKSVPVIMNDLKVFAETGQISEQKKERMQKLDKQLVSK